MYDAFGLLVDLSAQLHNLDEMQQHWSAKMLPEEQTRCGIAVSVSHNPSIANSLRSRSSRSELNSSVRLADDESVRKPSRGDRKLRPHASMPALHNSRPAAA